MSDLSIRDDQLKLQIDYLISLNENKDLICNYLNEVRNGFMYCVSDLIQLLSVTSSVQLWISIVKLIGPRIVNPSDDIQALLEKFKNAQHKNIV